MIRRDVLVAAIGSLCVIACGPSPRERRLVERWLLCEECTAGERDSVVALGDRAVPALADALVGPRPEHTDNVRRQFEASYARIAAAAAAASDTPAVSRAEYVEGFLSNFVAVYQSRAAIALGRIGTPRALDELRIALGRPPGFYRADVRRRIAEALGVTVAITAGNSQTATIGTAVAVDPAVVVREGSGRPARGVAVRFRPTAGSGQVTDSLRTTDDSGRAVVGEWKLGPTAGRDTLRAWIPGDTTMFMATATVSLAYLSIVAGDSQRVEAGTTVPVDPAVLATDAGGGPAGGVPVTFTVMVGGGAVTGGAATTGPTGVATVTSWMLGSLPGLNELRVSAPPRPDVTVTAIGTLSVLAVDAGMGYHTCARIPSGAGFCWGGNGSGRLGDGTTTNRSTPVAVLGGLTFAAIKAGAMHTCGLTPAGAAYCWGHNLNGQVGDGTTTNRPTPTAVDGGLTFSALSAGWSHTCGLATSGIIYCWGMNDRGQLGDSTTTDSAVPVPVNGGLIFTAVGAGFTHSCGLAASGSIYCWGRNNNGQLGDSTTASRSFPALVKGGLTVSQLAVGAGHNCALTIAGVAYCWGFNWRGEVGDGTTANRSMPVPVSGGLTFSGVTSGGDHSCGITTGGASYCWGRNSNGQLGDSTTTERHTPALVKGGLSFTTLVAGGLHTCAVTPDRIPYCWGLNLIGGLGDGTEVQRTVPTRVHEPQ